MQPDQLHACAGYRRSETQRTQRHETGASCLGTRWLQLSPETQGRWATLPDVSAAMLTRPRPEEPAAAQPLALLPREPLVELTERTSSRSKQSQASKALARQARHGFEAALLHNHGMSLMESRSVGRGVEADYHARWEAFSEWARLNHYETNELQDLGATLARYADEMLLSGKPASDFSKTRAACAHMRTDVTKAALLKRVVKAQKGFNKLAPGASWLPMPVQVAAILANEITLALGWQAGAAIMMMFVLYLRPSDVLNLMRQGLAPPTPVVLGAKNWSVVPHPHEFKHSSKVGEFDVSLIFDNPEFKHLDHVWARLREACRARQPLFSFSQAQLTGHCRRACERLGLAARGLHYFYQLRHAPHTRSTWALYQELHTRGKWASGRSPT